jgi:hypothetical protein
MNWKALVILALLLIIFLFPVFSNEAPLPKDLSSNEIATYLGNVVAYWKRVVIGLFKSLTGQLSQFLQSRKDV